MDKQNYKVSVIVPIFNVEPFLTKCITSVIAQDYSNLEIILVDDGSPDGCPSICDNFAKEDKRICVIHQTNKGVSAAKNAGIEKASGDYICFVDGDDYVSEDYVSYLLNLLVSSKADISVSKSMFSNYDRKQIKRDKQETVTGENAAIDILCYKMNIGVANKLFDSKLIKSRVRFLEHQRIGEGFNFNCTAFQMAQRVAVGYKKVYFYRQDNATSATTKFTKEKWENGLQSIDEIYEHLILKTDGIVKAWEFAKWRTNSDIYDLIVLSKNETTDIGFYNERKKAVKRNFKTAFKTNTSLKERIRAICFGVCPKLIPLIMKLRKKIFGVRVGN